MKQLMDSIIAMLLLLAVTTHLLRLINLVFNLRLLKRFSFLHTAPGKTELALYYILVIMICWRGFAHKIGQVLTP